MIIFVILLVSIVGIILIVHTISKSEDNFNKASYKSSMNYNNVNNTYGGFQKMDFSRYTPEYLKDVGLGFGGPRYGTVNNGYNDMLKRPEWRACREKVFTVKGRVCSYCRNVRNLQVHHKYYLKYPDGERIKPWEYNMECYMVLCDDCHRRVHEKYKIKTYYIRR